MTESGQEIVREWWRALEEAKGDRAALRRAVDLDDVLAIPAFHRLHAHLGRPGNLSGAAAGAVVTARIRAAQDHSPQSANGVKTSSDERAHASFEISSVEGLFKALAARPNETVLRMSPLRLAALIRLAKAQRITTDDNVSCAALIRSFGRMLALLAPEPGSIDPALTFDLVFRWNERTRRRAAMAYWERALDFEPKSSKEKTA